MLINFSTSPPSTDSLTRLSNSKLPISEFHLNPNPISQYLIFRHRLFLFFFKPQFAPKNRLFYGKSEYPFRRRLDCRSFSVSGFDVGSVESVLEAVGVLTAIIVVHESGHFLAAYLQGIHVSKFAVGFGPILAKFNAKNVECSIRAFPLGGFVGFPDNDPESGIPVDDENLLKNRPILDRVIVISAGVVANIIFALVIIFIQVISVGLPVQEAFSGVLVPEVRAFSAASRDGLFPGDVILSVNGNGFAKTGPSVVTELVDVIKKSPKTNVLLKVARGEQQLEVGITPDENYDGTSKIGVQLSPNVKLSKVLPKNLLGAFTFSGKEFWGPTYNVLDSLKQPFPTSLSRLVRFPVLLQS